MSAYCGTYGGNNFNWTKPILMGFIFLSGIVLGTHATKHFLADVVRNCPDNQIKLKLYNPNTGRKAIICQPNKNEDQYGRMIIELEDFIQKEITSFMGSEYRKNTLVSVIKNMCNQGYIKIEYIAPDIQEAVLTILSSIP